MRKKKLFALSTLFVLVMASPAFSITFSFTANPWGGSFDFNTNKGTVLYTFTLESLDPGESFVGVEAFFGNGLPSDASESPIITSFSLVGGSITNPSISLGTPSEPYSLLFTGTLSAGSGFQFLADLTLSQSPFNLTLPGGESSWSSAGPFAQNYNVFHLPPSSVGGPQSKPGSMGLAPEPGTVMLLGAGMLSLGLVERYRSRRRKRNSSVV